MRAKMAPPLVTCKSVRGGGSRSKPAGLLRYSSACSDAQSPSVKGRGDWCAAAIDVTWAFRARQARRGPLDAMADSPNGERPSLRPSLRVAGWEAGGALLDRPLEDEGKVLDALVAGLSAGEPMRELFGRLHDAALAQDR